MTCFLGNQTEFALHFFQCLSSFSAQQGSYKPSTEESKSNLGNLNLADYHPIDPSPSSRAAITSGPIEHGTPIIPYIPKVPPPSPPKQDGGSSPPV